MVYMMLSSICACVCCLLACCPVRRALPGPDFGCEGVQRPMPSDAVVLAMLAVAVRQGSSLPRAFEAVGDIVRGDFGAALTSVACALNGGYSWRDAWNGALHAHRAGQSMIVVHDALDEAWNRGASPVGPLENAIEQADETHRAAIEQGASRLSVRLLIPTGLCFLPSFILIGVIPAIASFGA